MTAPMFGKRSADRPAGGFEMFLKTFRDPLTKITFLWDNPKDEFIEYREHYDRAVGKGLSFPCAVHEGAARCVGCDYPVEHPEWTNEFIKESGMSRDERKKLDPGWDVRDAGGKWVFPAIDEKGYVSLYKIGFKFWKSLQGTYDTLGTITNQVFGISKSGQSFNEIQFQAIPLGGEAQKPKENATLPTASYVSELLGKKYLEAFQAYVEMGLTNEDGTPNAAAQAPGVPDPDPVEIDRTGDPAKDGLAARKARAEAKGTTPDEAQTMSEAPAAPPEGWDPNLNAREADSADLKTWLEQRPEDRGGPIEFPAKAARSVLMGLVERAQAEMATAGVPNF